MLLEDEVLLEDMICSACSTTGYYRNLGGQSERPKDPDEASRNIGAARMIDHVSLRVANYDRSKKFYEALLAPLGYTLGMESASGAGFRKESIPAFWIKQGEPVIVGTGTEPTHLLGCGGPFVHVAFASKDRSTVDAFHRAALAAGARDNGAPRLRPEYHPNYYGAFVLDPDGYNIEAVCHRAE